MGFIPTLPPRGGYVETDKDGTRVYRSVTRELYISPSGGIVTGDPAAELEYNNANVANVEYDGVNITVDEASKIWLLLAASGRTDEATALQAKIRQAIEENTPTDNEE